MNTALRIASLAGLVLAGAASAQSAAPGAPARVEPLRDVPANVRTQSLATGAVTHHVQVQVPAGEAPVTVRSIQPDSVVGDYRIDFQALDTDGDGFISLDEARANPALADEFDSLDSRRSGRLSREQLAGWLAR